MTDRIPKILTGCMIALLSIKGLFLLCGIFNSFFLGQTYNNGRFLVGYPFMILVILPLELVFSVLIAFLIVRMKVER